MNGRRRRTADVVLGVAGLLCALCLGGLVDDATAQPKPEGEMRWALYVTISAAWLDPAEVVGQLTPSGCSMPSTMRSSNPCPATS